MAIFSFIVGGICGFLAVSFGWLLFDIGLWQAVALFYGVGYVVGLFPLLRAPVFLRGRIIPRTSRVDFPDCGKVQDLGTV